MKTDLQRIEYHDNKTLLLSSSLLVTFILFIYAPLEMYFSNANEFWFTIQMFWWIPILVGGIAFCFIYFVGKLIPTKYLAIYALLILGLGLAVYIQGNFLNLSVGVLNGEEINWSKYKDRFVINIVVWICVVVIPLLLYFVLKKNRSKYIKICTIIGSFILIVQVITLSIMFFTTKIDSSKTESYAISDKNLFELSTDKNTVVFVLDMFDDSYFKQILEETPEIKNEYKGFTYFSNSVGSYSTTQYSFTALLTNKVNHNSSLSLVDEIDKEYDEGTMFQDLIANNVDIDMYAYEVAMPKSLLKSSTNYVKLTAKIGNYVKFTKRLYRLVSCKYAPDVLKVKYWMDGSEFNNLKVQTDGNLSAFNYDNKIIYDSFCENQITTSAEDRFKFIHINGSHYPYKIDENVEVVDAEMNRENAVKTARGCLKIVNEYMDKMKEANVYDNSQIIIMADHGYYLNGTLTNPLFMIKQSGSSTEDFKISNAPISHYDFQATVMENWNLNTNDKYGKSVFDVGEDEKRERLFYQYYLQETADEGKYRLIEYSVDSENNLRKSFHLTDNEYTTDGELISHLKYCAYCQKHGEGSDDVDGEEVIIHNRK